MFFSLNLRFQANRKGEGSWQTQGLVVFSTAGAFLGLPLRVDAAWVIVTGVRYVTVCRASSRFANHAKKSPGSYNNSHTRQEIGVRKRRLAASQRLATTVV